jgi:hypothetical protein
MKVLFFKNISDHTAANCEPFLQLISGHTAGRPVSFFFLTYFISIAVAAARLCTLHFHGPTSFCVLHIEIIVMYST